MALFGNAGILSGIFDGTSNPDGTTGYLGGLLTYDPRNDIGQGDRLGLFGASLKDAAAQFSGHPEAANSLDRYSATHRQQMGQRLLMDVLQGTQGRLGGQASGQPPAPLALPSPMAGGDPMMLDRTLPELPGQDAGEAAGPVQGGYDLKALAPKLALAAAAGADIGPVLDIIKMSQPKYSTTPQFNAEGRGYVPADDGTVKWLGPDVTQPHKVVIAPNGLAYDPLATKPGTAFNNPNAPLNPDGTPNIAYQKYEHQKAVEQANLGAQNNPNALLVPILRKMQNGQPLTQGEQNVLQAQKPSSGFGGITPSDDPVVKSYVANVLNGNATLRNVPMGMRGSVSVALSQAPKGAYSPTAQNLYTRSAHNITRPYTDMAQYKLTADGLPYLQRIDAALKHPGSVSDQDLLDSLTKLNTGGNAITDAQVKLITDGKSYSDWVSAVKNRFNNGGVLSDNQRQQIKRIANDIFANYRKGYQPVYEQATKQLREAGIPETFWTIPDLNKINDAQAASFSGNASANTPHATQPSSPPRRVLGDSDYARLPSGTVFIGPDGVRRRKP
jgi:hypothetical protein